MPAVYIALAVTSQIALAAVGLVGLLPITWLRVATRAAINALLGTLGQSFALQTSTIRRAAIVASVTQSLDWLSDKCHRVVVIAHSQGAEISRLVFLDRRRPDVVRWYTAGSGIAPLSMLHPKSIDTPSARFVIRVSKTLFFITLAAVTALAVDAIPGVPFDVQESLLRLAQAIGWWPFAWGYGVFLLILAAAFFFKYGPLVDPLWRRSVMDGWHDIYASQDPVPGGSLLDRFADDLMREELTPMQRRIFNTRFELSDHTTYFRNTEEFVAPVALDLLRLAGLGCPKQREDAPLQRAARRRDLYTWWTMVLWSIGLAACAAAAALVAFGPARRGAVWLEWASSLWELGDDFWERLGLFWSRGLVGQMLLDLWLCAAIGAALALGLLARRWLEKRSVQRLLEDLAGTARAADSTPAPP